MTASDELAKIGKLAIICDDCGHRRVWSANDLVRARLRWGVKTAVQLGSRLSCKHCASRGQGGRNISIYADPPVVEPADNRRSLADALRVVSTCSDCGDQVRLERNDLDMMPAVKNFGELWANAFCPACRASGAAEANVVVSAEWATSGAAQPPKAVVWSTKEVFTEKRGDPYPNLPRSALMRCG